MIAGWKAEIENEYLQALRESPQASPADLAARVGESECCAIYWLSELAREGRIRILTVEPVKEGDVPCAPRSFRNCGRKAACPIPEVAQTWLRSREYPNPEA